MAERAWGGSLFSASPRLRRTTPSGCMGTDGAGRGEGRSFSGGLLSNPVGWLVNKFLFSCQVMDLRVAERAKRIITLCVAAAPTHNTLWVYGYRRGRAGRTMGVRSRIKEFVFRIATGLGLLGFFLFV